MVHDQILLDGQPCRQLGGYTYPGIAVIAAIIAMKPPRENTH